MMKAPCSQLALILAGSLLITGCRTIPVVPHAISCEINAELLSNKCSPPRQIANDANFAMLVDTMQTDRQALRECGILVDSLRETLNRCNEATREFNKTIDARNSVK